jgi:hypothetical protein
MGGRTPAESRAHHGKILAQAVDLAEAGKLRPFLNEQRFSDIDAAHAPVESAPWGRLSSTFKVKAAKGTTK